MSIWTMLLIYDQVIRVGPDGLSLEPGLAESWEVSDDGLTYTFNLREANFHDGTPVTAEDVAFCLNRTAFDEASSMTFFFSAVDNFEATDERTVVATLNDVWVPFEADLALFGASIFPQAAFEAQGEELWEAPIGSGPFMFDSWERGAQIVLNKNPEYWDEGKPYLDQLTFKVLTDSNARMLQFQGGELDIVTDVPFNQIEPLSQNPDYVTLPDDAAARIDYIALNVTRAAARRQEAAPGDQLRGRQGRHHPERPLRRRRAGHVVPAADGRPRSGVAGLSVRSGAGQATGGRVEQPGRIRL